MFKPNPRPLGAFKVDFYIKNDSERTYGAVSSVSVRAA